MQRKRQFITKKSTYLSRCYDIQSHTNFGVGFVTGRASVSEVTTERYVISSSDTASKKQAKST